MCRSRCARFTLVLGVVSLVTIMSTADAAAQPAQKRPLVIAHRGASGYLPEHTLAAKVLAHAMQADYIEQDVVLTRDNVPVVLHDLYLERVTNVEQVYPGRARADGRFYVIDFTLEELQRLQVHERTNAAGDAVVYPGRFPGGVQSPFRIATLDQEIELIQGLNRSTGRQIGIYTEIKSPEWHRSQQRDISRIVLQTLARHGYRSRTDAVYLQCFDADETRRVREELESDLKLVQLLGSSAFGDRQNLMDPTAVRERMQQIAEYADGIGPAIPLVWLGNESGQPVFSPLVRMAHEHHLVVHPYTLRDDALGPDVESAAELVDLLFRQAHVDGIFTDFPDTTRSHLLPFRRSP